MPWAKSAKASGRGPSGSPAAAATRVGEGREHVGEDRDDHRNAERHDRLPHRGRLLERLAVEQRHPAQARASLGRDEAAQLPPPDRRRRGRGLAQTLPAAILADLLGISEHRAGGWTRAANGEWARYAAEASGQLRQPRAP